MEAITYRGPREKSVRLLRALYRLFPFPLEADGEIPPARPGVALSVIIPTHTRKQGRLPFEALETCLQSLAIQNVPEEGMEVLVVEDGPLSDRTIETIGRFKDSLPIRHLPADTVHRHRGWLRNLGLRESRGSRILMIDDDTLLFPDFLANCFSLFGRADPERDFILPHGYARYGLLEPRWDFLEDYSLATQCIIYPRPLLEKIKGFHSGLDRFEDIDLAIRSYLAGGRSLEAPQLRFWNPPLYLPLNSPASRERALLESDAYLRLRSIYSLPVWIGLLLKEVLKLPHLVLPASREKRTFAALAWYTLTGLFAASKKKGHSQ